jgi:hypothetical protein
MQIPFWLQNKSSIELAVWKQGSINDDIHSCRLFMLPWFQTAVRLTLNSKNNIQVVKNANGWVLKNSLQGGQKPSLMSPQFLNFEKKGQLEGVLFPLFSPPEREFSLENHENLALLLLFISLLLEIIAPLSALGDHAIAGL